MVEQVATASGFAAHFDSLNESRVVFEHPVDSFLDELRGFLAGTSGKLLQAGFFVGRKTNFHRDYLPIVSLFVIRCEKEPDKPTETKPGRITEAFTCFS